MNHTVTLKLRLMIDFYDDLLLLAVACMRAIQTDIYSFSKVLMKR